MFLFIIYEVQDNNMAVLNANTIGTASASGDTQSKTNLKRITPYPKLGDLVPIATV